MKAFVVGRETFELRRMFHTERLVIAEPAFRKINDAKILHNLKKLGYPMDGDYAPIWLITANCPDYLQYEPGFSIEEFKIDRFTCWPNLKEPNEILVKFDLNDWK